MYVTILIYSFAGYEGQGWDLIFQGQNILKNASFIWRLVRCDNPCRIGVFLDASLLKTDDGPFLVFCIHLGNTQSEAETFFIHKVCEICLRSRFAAITRKVHMSWSAYDFPAGSGRNGYQIT